MWGLELPKQGQRRRTPLMKSLSYCPCPEAIWSWWTLSLISRVYKSRKKSGLASNLTKDLDNEESKLTAYIWSEKRLKGLLASFRAK